MNYEDDLQSSLTIPSIEFNPYP